MDLEQLDAAWNVAEVGKDRPPLYPTGTALCPAESPYQLGGHGYDGGFVCLRPEGHEGQHVATVPGEVVATWTDLS
jgi:hypothetical protein